MKIAVVTGASSGLGREFALQLARTEKQLEEIWVIARRQDRLEALRPLCPVPLRVLPLDLTAPGAADALEAALAAAAPEVAVLVNAAGFGRMGDWQAVPRQDSAAMIRLNCQAAVEVTQICLPHMRPGGRVLEICSTAAFQPFPYLNVYAATKAFLYRYSLALGRELRRQSGGAPFPAGLHRPAGSRPRPSGQPARPGRLHPGAGLHRPPGRRQVPALLRPHDPLGGPAPALSAKMPVRTVFGHAGGPLRLLERQAFLASCACGRVKVSLAFWEAGVV